MAYIPVKLAKMRLHPAAKSVKNLGEFARELVGMYTAFFNRRDLPVSIAGLKRPGLANAYYRAANSAFWSQKWVEASHYGRISLSYQPWNWKTWALLCLSNPLGRRLAYKLLKNPHG
jgi:hypothetical protein